MAVRDDQIVEIPTENRLDAPPNRRLVPDAELDIHRGAAVLAQDARHALDAAPNPRFARGFMLLDGIRDDERLGGFVQKRDLIQNAVPFNHAMIDLTAPRGLDLIREQRIDGDIGMTLVEGWRGPKLGRRVQRLPGLDAEAVDLVGRNERLDGAQRVDPASVARESEATPRPSSA